jgi:two-component system chemotaxis response regulator CheB
MQNLFSSTFGQVIRKEKDMSVMPKAFLDSGKNLFLLPGQIACVQQETLITTVLGSCVAVVLHDPLTKIGGMNHFLLPETPNNEIATARYGNFAIPKLIDEIERLGGDRFQLQAKVFGAASVISNNPIGESIGRRNQEIALKILRDSGISIIRKDLGGVRSRKITFNTATFEILVKYNGERESA